MKIKLDPWAIMPTRAHDTDAGLDLYAPHNEIVPAHGSALFDTGVHVQFPPNTAGMIKSKSGLNVNHGITSEGVIDVGYTIGSGLKLDEETNTLSVDTADQVEADNDKPITAAAVFTAVGNIQSLLESI